MSAASDLMREWLKHSPPPGPIADGLLGWNTPHGEFYCAVCVGRVMARGIATQEMRNSSPVWAHSTNAPPDYGVQAAPAGPCSCCGKRAA